MCGVVGFRKAKTIHRVSPANWVLSALESIYLPSHTLVTSISQYIATTSSHFQPYTFTRTFTSAAMGWWRSKTYSKLSNTTTSHNQTATTSSPSTTKATASSSSNAPPPPHREMWQCCKCGNTRNLGGTICAHLFRERAGTIQSYQSKDDLLWCKHRVPCERCRKC